MTRLKITETPFEKTTNLKDIQEHSKQFKLLLSALQGSDVWTCSGALIFTTFTVLFPITFLTLIIPSLIITQSGLSGRSEKVDAYSAKLLDMMELFSWVMRGISSDDLKRAEIKELIMLVGPLLSKDSIDKTGLEVLVKNRKKPSGWGASLWSYVSTPTEKPLDPYEEFLNKVLNGGHMLTPSYQLYGETGALRLSPKVSLIDLCNLVMSHGYQAYLLAKHKLSDDETKTVSKLQ